MKRLLLLATLSFAIVVANAGTPYDFRASAAYKKLSKTDRDRLEQVQRDFAQIWGALERYADENDGNPPMTLDELTPRFLPEVPTDPFATKKSAKEPMTHTRTTSKGGMGYRYTKGALGNRAWVIVSVGLPEFPYLGERNSGLYLCKGTWISGINPMITQ